MEKFTKKDIPNLRYGVVSSQYGYSDGVSIVMKQLEGVMSEQMGISKSNIFYLVGRSKEQSPMIRQRSVLWHKSRAAKTANKYFESGFGGHVSELIEGSITKAVSEIEAFFREKKIDVLIAHNTSHPTNFILSVALSRYYRDALKKGSRTPKYILWWHDSHLERRRYSKPSPDVQRYLLEGLPGKYVEYIIFINSLQADLVQKYFRGFEDKIFYENIFKNSVVIYNTATTLIDSTDDLDKKEYTDRAEKFLDEFGITSFLKSRKLKLEDVQFCLQHTRIVPRKRIDFALEYSYALLDRLKKRRLRKAMVFLVSGHHGDEIGNYKSKLKKLNRRLSKEYGTDSFHLVFAEDFKRSNIHFEEFPLIISKLGGIATYFSEIEGFGNNLLEIFAAGLIPAVYTYPVFVKDISKYSFKLIAFDKFDVDPECVERMVELISSPHKYKMWANRNIKILNKKFSYEVISGKFIRKRLHG